MVNAWILTLPWKAIDSLSRKHGINPVIVGAIVMQESAGNTSATRYEENYRWLLHPDRYSSMNNISRMTEVNQQKTSWGLMQVMGGVARELGFEGPLVDLCKPEIGIDLGIKKLMQLKEKYKDNINDVLASYNAGSPRLLASGDYVNQYYVNSVNKYIKELL